MKNIGFLLLIMFCLLAAGCHDKGKVEQFVAKIDPFLSLEEKEDLKDCYDVYCMKSFVFDQDTNEFKIAFWSSVPEFYNTMDSMGISDTLDVPIALMIAYHDYLNNHDFSIERVRKGVVSYRDDLAEWSSIYDELIFERKQKLGAIEERNFYKYNAGDTICLQLPLSPKAKYYDLISYPSVYNEKSFSDTLFVRCIVMDKDRGEIAAEGIPLASFTLKLLEVTSRKNLDPTSKWNEGKLIDWYFRFYGRYINTCNN